MELNTLETLTGEVSVDENSSHESVCEAIATAILQSGIATESQGETGIYLVSPDAGAAPAVSFWALAREQGPAFLSPINFPWTLANGPATFLARRLNAHGPNITLVGSDIAAAETQARNDLQRGMCDRALLIYIEFGNSTAPAHFEVSTLSLTSIQPV